MAMVHTGATATFKLGKVEIGKLKAVADVAAKRFPVACTYVLLTSMNGILDAYATDLSMYAMVEIMDGGDMDGVIRVAIPAKQIKAMKPGATLTLIVDGNGKYNIDGLTGVGIECESMPHHPELLATSQTVAVGAQYFDDFTACAMSAAESEIRPVLQAVCHRGNKLISTDGLRLLQVETSHTWTHDILLPAEHAKHLQRLFGNTGATMTYDEYTTRYDAAGVRVYVKSISGRYPDVSRIIPTQYNAAGTIADVQPWSDALATACKLSGKGERPLTVVLCSDHASVTIDNKDGVTFGTNVPYTGDETSIQCNPAYLGDALQQTGDGATVRIVDDRTPFVVQSADDKRLVLVAQMLKR